MTHCACTASTFFPSCVAEVRITLQEAAEVQSILEGVPLPATKDELLAYARREDEAAAGRLRSLPEREYRSLDEVGEALVPVQPSKPEPRAALPREESGAPPGGGAYIDPHTEPGRVRPGGSGS